MTLACAPAESAYLAADVVFHVRDYHALRDLMRTRFPAVFTARGVPPVPLMVDACTELERRLAGVVAPRRVRGFLSVWCRRPEYLAMIAQSQGQPRYDLDGVPVGRVSGAHVAWTRRRIEQRAIRPARMAAPGSDAPAPASPAGGGLRLAASPPGPA